MTITTDQADSSEIPRLVGETARHITAEHRMRVLDDEPTRNLASYMLRQGEVYSRHRLSAADTMIVRTDLTADPEQVADAHLRAGEPFLVGDLAAPSGRDAWITTVEIPPFLSYALSGGGLQDPPTGEPPKLPPPPPTKAERPAGFRPAHRRRISVAAKWFLIGAGVVAAVLLGLDLAALLVMGGLR